jgi:hypothetical protein
MDYYDREGMPMAMMDWARTFEDMSYRRVKVSVVNNLVVVSTVWLGLNHRWGPGPPLIFETMTFPVDKAKVSSFSEMPELFGRYSSEGMAEAGHDAIVERLVTLLEGAPAVAELEGKGV